MAGNFLGSGEVWYRVDFLDDEELSQAIADNERKLEQIHIFLDQAYNEARRRGL